MTYDSSVLMKYHNMNIKVNTSVQGIMEICIGYTWGQEGKIFVKYLPWASHFTSGISFYFWNDSEDQGLLSLSHRRGAESQKLKIWPISPFCSNVCPCLLPIFRQKSLSVSQAYMTPACSIKSLWRYSQLVYSILLR